MAQSAAKPENENAAAVPDPAKSKTDLVGIVLLVLVTLNVAAVATLGIVVQKLWSHLGSLQGAVQKLAADEEPTEEGTVGKELQTQNLGMLYPLDAFLVNVQSEQGPKFLQTQMELELSDPALEDELSRKKAAVRDAIIVLLSSRSFKELRAANGLKHLREDLVKAINGLLSNGKIKEIYFTQFHFN
jgi:flagellar FliL protein